MTASNGVRLVVHPQHQVLHAEQVDGVVPEGRPVAAEDGVLPVIPQGLVADGRDVHPVRVGPGVVVDLLDRGVGQRVPTDLVDLLQVSRSTVHHWAADGTLPAIILNEGERKRTFRFDPDEIEEWLRSRATRKQA